MSCPCGSGAKAESCCGRYLTGGVVPETAEALMRSRYTAFVEGAVDYILDTHHPDKRHEIDRDETEAWSRESDWAGLRIRRTEAGGPGDDTGLVEFVVQYVRKGEEYLHHELAEFRRHEGRWYFYDGDTPEPITKLRTGPKVGRNDPCPCGSGKKHKKCCGAG